MDHQIHFVKTTRTARYLSFGNLSPKTKYFWFVLHGSHMLAEQMVNKFKDFDPDLHYIIAPEALSRFYIKGFGGEVVSSWMTSRDRLNEIEDFSKYLSRLYRKYTDQLPIDCKRVVLGFSQGATTAFRWLHHTKEQLDVLIDYSGWIPEDIILAKSKTDLNKTKLILTYGLEDPFLNKDRIDMMHKIIKSNHLDIRIEDYTGIHKIDRKQLIRLFDFYIK